MPSVGVGVCCHQRLSQAQATVARGDIGMNFRGQGAITAFEVRVNGMKDPADQWAALRALTVSVVLGRETNSSVWAPLGDFFGTPCGYIPYTALPLGMQSNDWMYCFWYMPFASQARIVIGNDGSVTRNVDVVITRAPLTKPTAQPGPVPCEMESRRLCDQQRSFAGLPVSRHQRTRALRRAGAACLPDRGRDARAMVGRGGREVLRGRRKDAVLVRHRVGRLFWLFWGTPGYFTKAYHTQALAPSGTLYAPGNRALNRFQITDNVPFQHSFDGCVEKWFYTNDTITTYGTIPYWYLAPGGRDPYSALPLSSRTNYTMRLPIDFEPQQRIP